MECSICRVLQFNIAMQYSEIIVMNNDTNISSKCMFSWSTDGVCWVDWVSYDSFNSIVRNIEGDLYIKILICGSFSSVYINGVPTKCYNLSLYQPNLFASEPCIGENIFSPYANLDCALQLQQQLSDNIICLFGIPVYYFRVVPDRDTADITFKEYIMHNVESIKQIKIMIQDGQMPSSKPMFSEWDWDFAEEWEVEIGKTSFATAFGDEAFPKYQDFIYIPMMKRMWSVNAAYDEKNEGLMWRSTTWKLILTKYNESTAISTNDFEEFIDNINPSMYSDIFGCAESREQEIQTGITQLDSPKIVNTSLVNVLLEDANREMISKDVVIRDENLSHRNVIFAKNSYLFKDVNTPVVVYQKKYCGDEGNIIIALNINKGGVQTNIISMGDIAISINDNIINFNGMEQALDYNSIYSIHAKWSKKLHVCTLSIYPYIVPNIQRMGTSYFDFENPICNISSEYNFDFSIEKLQDIILYSSNSSIYNVKVFNKYIDTTESVKESIKYTTNNEYCLVNDNCRPLFNNHGYPVR